MSNITTMITEGKAKRLYATEKPDEAVVYYRDETFAFHGLKRGRIIGKGTHQELLASCPMYAELCQLQLGGDAA